MDFIFIFLFYFFHRTDCCGFTSTKTSYGLFGTKEIGRGGGRGVEGVPMNSSSQGPRLAEILNTASTKMICSNVVGNSSVQSNLCALQLAYFEQLWGTKSQRRYLYTTNC